jgi:hypothetical protein
VEHTSDHGGRARGAVLTTGLVAGPPNHPAVRMAGFAKFGPQNFVTAVLGGTGVGTWRDRGGCVKATLCEGRGRRIGNLGVGPFRPGEVDRLYVNRDG